MIYTYYSIATESRPSNVICMIMAACLVTKLHYDSGPGKTFSRIIPIFSLNGGDVLTKNHDIHRGYVLLFETLNIIFRFVGSSTAGPLEAMLLKAFLVNCASLRFSYSFEGRCRIYGLEHLNVLGQ